MIVLSPYLFKIKSYCLFTVELQSEVFSVYLSELNKIPEEYAQDKLESKGFYEEIIFQFGII